MKSNQEYTDNYIKRLIDITESIRKIYAQLAEAINDSEKTKELEEYLEIAISIENTIYKEIDKKIVLNDLGLKRISYLIHKSKLEEKDKDRVETRIRNYIVQKTYQNPFLSRETSPKERQSENLASIKCQVCLDYFRNLILNTDEELNKETNESKKVKLSKAKYNVIFSNKLVNNLVKNKNFCNSNGRIRCITLNQDERVVNNIFSSYATTMINNTIYSMLKQNGPSLRQIELKSALSLLTEKEILHVMESYNNSINKNQKYKHLAENNPNNKTILEIIASFLPKEKEKEKSLN